MTDSHDVLIDISTSLMALAGATVSSDELAREVLAQLRLALPYDGASLQSFDPSTGEHSVLAAAGEVAGIDGYLAGHEVFVSSLDEGWPALTEHDGGLSAGLYTADGRYAGVLHLWLSQPHLAVDLITRLAPLLGGLVDVMRLPSQLAADSPTDMSAAVVRPDASVMSLPQRPTSPLLEDGAALPRAIADAHQREELPDRFRWRDDDGGWHAIVARHTGNGVMVTLDSGELPFGLTAREVEVLTLVVGGFSNPQIAELLDVTGKTVAKHVEHVLAKLGVQSRAAAAAQAVRFGLIELATLAPSDGGTAITRSGD